VNILFSERECLIFKKKKENMKSRIVITLLLIMIIMVNACSKVESQTRAGSGKAGDFTLNNVAGEEITLSEESVGKKGVLVFFATWCPSCMSEVPAVNRFYEKYKDKVFLTAVNIQESGAKVAGFMSKKNVLYPILLDEKGNVVRQYQVRGIPAVFAFDENRTILYSGHSIEEMERKVQF